MAAVEVLRAVGAQTAQGAVEILRATGSVAPSPRVEVLRATASVVVALTANAGADQLDVIPGTRVYLNGRASAGRPDLHHWQQTGGDGPIVEFDPSADVDGPSFIAPYTPQGCELRFTLFVANTGGDFIASPDEVVIRVRRHPVFIKRGGELQPIGLDAVLRMVGVAA